MRSILAAFARNRVFANIVLALIFTAGTLAIFNMVRETFPEMEVDVIIVTVPWPGADPEEVEEGISRKIEEAIEGIDGIKEYNTFSRENVGIAQIEVLEEYDLDYVKERVRNAIEAISTFPVDAEKPVTESFVWRSQVLILALFGEDLTEKQLKEWSERTKDELRALDGVSQVMILGSRDYEIAIEVSEEKLREYGLNFSQVAQLVRASSLNLSGGVMRTEGEEIRLRTLGRKYTAREFADIVVLARPNGEIITLDRIAEIHDDFVEDKVISRFNGKPAINVMVQKTAEEDTLAIDTAVRDWVAAKQRILPEGVHMQCWAGLAGILQSRINLLARNGIIGLSLVFILLWLFLDIRLSFWAGMGMPVSVAGALAIMWGMGETINMISLFGLIMVLGIIVDDAIVVGEAIYVARKNGAPPLKAAVDGVMEVGMPVVGAVTTTIVAFIPLMYVGGIMGKFIIILPIVVIACLTISLIECLILLPAHLNHLPSFEREIEKGHPVKRFGQRFHRSTNEGLEWVVHHLYEPFIARALRWRYVSLAIALAVLMSTTGLMQSGVLKFQFFPAIDGNSAIATIEFPNGTPIEVTEDAIEKLRDAIERISGKTETRSGDPMILNVFTLTGATISPDQQGKSGSHVGSVFVELLDSAERGLHTDKLLAQWEEGAGAIPGVVALTFTGEEAGPPGAPIEIWIQGHDMKKILAAADDIKKKLGNYEGVYQIQDDFRPGKNELRLRLKPEARTLGLTVADLARQIYAGYFGEEAIRIQRGRDDIRVRVRYPERERAQVSEFEKIRIRTPQGMEVPLISVADIDFGPGYAVIQRTDGMRRVSVTADVNAERANSNEILNELAGGFFGGLERDYGVRISLQGEKRNMRESFSTLAIGYPLALLGIFIIIATIFRSYVQPLVIMITVPFGIIGAFFGHLLLGYDLSIMSFFGMVALSGVVVNDAIVLIECINSYLAQGVPFYESLRLGGARRFRAIFLTSLSTVGGLTPLMLERDMQARFLIPMAIAIAAGVAFATLLTLLLIPCLLAILNDLRRIAFVSRHKRWPSHEEVEPARWRYTDQDEIEAQREAAAAEGGATGS
jgi:multidrug efflux pump subunit AcrB